MRKVHTLLLLATLCTTALCFAGEKRLGFLQSYGNSVSNADAGVPFAVPGNKKLTIQCKNSAVTVCADSLNCSNDGGVNDGVWVAASTVFPTSNGFGGTGQLSIIGDGDAGCTVFQRDGTE